MKHFVATILLAISTLGLMGCEEDLGNYYQVEDLRLMGIRAEPPELQPGESTVLDALVTTRTAEYSWSWCPLPFGGDNEDECPIAYADLQMLVAMTGGQVDPPPFDLGQSDQAQLAHLLPPPLLKGICDQFASIDLPEGIKPPACDGRLSVQVRLVLEDEGKTLAANRELSLIYEEEAIANQNPAIDGGELSVRGAPAFPLTGEEPAIVARDVEYKVLLDIDEAHAEPFLDPEEGELTETLTVSWFYEEGAMDKGRSSYLEGAVEFPNLLENHYRTPTEEELESEQARLFFVIRDNRGGLNWFTASLELSL
jgi:hypothetical protein